MDYRDVYDVMDAEKRGEPPPPDVGLDWQFWRFVVVYVLAVALAISAVIAVIAALVGG